MKKQIIAFSSLCIVAITMFFYSCSTENLNANENAESLSENSILNYSRLNLQSPENARNPYDEVGEMHNVV